MIKKSIIVNTVFTLLGQLMRFIFGVGLARILFPMDFGIYGMSLLVVETALLFTGKGFLVALIQREKIDDRSYNTVAVLSFVSSVVLAVIIFAYSNRISAFFNAPALTDLLKVHVFALMITALEIAPSASLLRDIKFKEVGFGSALAALANGLIAIICACMGFGAISLVIGYIAECFTRYLAFKIIAGKMGFAHAFSFTRDALIKLAHVGVGVTALNVFNYIAENIDYFWIGRLTSASELGLYTRAYKLMRIPVQQIGHNFAHITVPIFSKIQKESDEIKSKFFKITQVVSMSAFPLFCVLYFYCPSLIYIVYGEKWMAVVEPLRMLIVAGAAKAVSSFCGNILKAKGLVYREVAVQTICTLLLIFCGYFAVKEYGIMGMVKVVVFTSILFWGLITMVLMWSLGMPFLRYMRIFAPSIVICGILLAGNFAFLILYRPASYKDPVYPAAGILMSGVLYICALVIIKNKCLLSQEIGHLQNVVFNFVKMPFRKV